VRRWGAASLDLAYVAGGRYDGYWERRLNIWDIAAGLIIAREAGAIIDGLKRGSKPEETGDLICATEVQFEAFAHVIRSS
jgi:myo-inositol-1(or 4)-monophosphatase